MTNKKRESRSTDRPYKSPAAEAEQHCSDLINRCRARGIRITPQRLAVYKALAGDDSHPTAEAIYARLRSGMASLSLATVYRILEFLEKEKLVRRVSTTDAAGRFDANLARHHHLVCRICGKMTDFEQAFLVRPAPRRPLPGAFRAEELDVRILGTCQSCRRAALRRPRRDTPTKHQTRGDEVAPNQRRTKHG